MSSIRLFTVSQVLEHVVCKDRGLKGNFMRVYCYAS